MLECCKHWTRHAALDRSGAHAVSTGLPRLLNATRDGDHDAPFVQRHSFGFGKFVGWYSGAEIAMTVEVNRHGPPTPETSKADRPIVNIINHVTQRQPKNSHHW